MVIYYKILLYIILFGKKTLEDVRKTDGCKYLNIF